MSVCGEPDGNELAIGFDQLAIRDEADVPETQHQVCMRLMGQCPWCGEEEQ